MHKFWFGFHTRTLLCNGLLRRKLRVVPLSLSPSCVTRKKTARKKWPREILGAALSKTRVSNARGSPRGTQMPSPRAAIIKNAPPPGPTTWANAPRLPGGGDGHCWNWLMHNCCKWCCFLSWISYLSAFSSFARDCCSFTWRKLLVCLRDVLMFLASISSSLMSLELDV